MRPSEWTDLVTFMRGYWPHAPIPAESAALQYEFVEGLDAAAGRAVVKLFAGESREHPPTAGMIVSRALELASPTPAWDQVQAEVEGAVVAKRPEPEALPCEGCDESGFVYDEKTSSMVDCACRPERIKHGQQQHEWSHELVAEWMTRPRWQRWIDAINAGVGIATFRAQERDSFLAMRKRWLEDRTLALAGVDRAELKAPTPRAQLRRGALRQLDTSSVQTATSPLTPD